MNIFRKARGEQISKQAQRVFLGLDPQNIADKDKIISDILDMKYGVDCVVSWIETTNEAIDEEELRNELHDTHTLVLWVTSELLQSVSAKKIPKAFEIARELKRPVIPIANDGTLFPYFTELVDAIHGIAINDAEYHEKLKKQLDNFLATEELVKEIEEKAFTARIFLSYRKMDIRIAREFMKTFHDLPGFEAISIWYDNFLTAGRIFDDEIKQSIIKSDAFTLLVTPNLLEKNDEGKDNYVVSTEYPFARNEGKVVIPVEAKTTDAERFEMMFDGAGKAICVEDADVLSTVFKNKLDNAAFAREMDNERTYLLGTAYLNGLGVERDYERAIVLLETAAKESDLFALEAVKSLDIIYSYGIGTSVDYSKRLYLNQREAQICEQLFGVEHLKTFMAYNKVSSSYKVMGEYQKAKDWLQKTAKIRNLGFLASNREGHGIAHVLSNTAMIDLNNAKVYDSQGNYSKAIELYTKALIIAGNSSQRIELYQGLGTVYLHKGSYNQAMDWYQKALDMTEKLLGTEHLFTASIYHNIGTVCSKNDKRKGLEWFKKAMVINEKVLGPEHPDTVQTYHNLAETCREIGNYHEALEWIRKTLSVREKILGTEHPQTVASYSVVAAICYEQGEFQKSLEWYQKVIALREKIFGKEHPSTATAYNNIAHVYYQQGNFSRALHFLEEASKIYTKHFGLNHPRTENVSKTIALVVNEQMKDDLKTENSKTSQDIMYLLNNGEINEAEDLLFERLETDFSDSLLDDAFQFYKKLRSYNSAWFAEHNFSLQEVENGWNDFYREFFKKRNKMIPNT